MGLQNLFAAHAAGNRAVPYGPEALPLEYALNIMAFPARSYKPQNSFVASGARYPFLTAGCVTLKRQVIFINNF